MKDISKLTEKTQGIESSDGKQLGIVDEIVGNDIAMESYVGERGTFILPRGMIARIKRKTVYLNLTKKEFEAWWRKEGPLQIAEYPAQVEVALGRKLLPEDLELLREDIRTSFDMNFGGDIASTFLGFNRCPICGSGVTLREIGSCKSCGLEFIEGDSGQYEISEEYKEHMYEEQERLRQEFSSRVRELLRLDEWVYHSADFYRRRPHHLSVEEEVVVVTSKRVFRFNPKRAKRHFWEIPVDKMTGVRVFVEDRYISGDRISWWRYHRRVWWRYHRRGWRKSGGPLALDRATGEIFPFKIFQFDYTSGRRTKSKESAIYIEEYRRWSDRRAAQSIDKYVQRAKKVMELRKSMGIE
ncbi:MAG: hypothetical protein ACFFBS_03890 [Promethearchaeota archaeon]